MPLQRTQQLRMQNRHGSAFPVPHGAYMFLPSGGPTEVATPVHMHFVNTMERPWLGILTQSLSDVASPECACGFWLCSPSETLHTHLELALRHLDSTFLWTTTHKAGKYLLIATPLHQKIAGSVKHDNNTVAAWKSMCLASARVQRYVTWLLCYNFKWAHPAPAVTMVTFYRLHSWRSEPL